MAYRVALYCRVSTSDQRCQTQSKELRDYVERQPGWEIYKEYVDSGFSGATARQALDALMKDASKKKRHPPWWSTSWIASEEAC